MADRKLVKMPENKLTKVLRKGLGITKVDIIKKPIGLTNFGSVLSELVQLMKELVKLTKANKEIRVSTVIANDIFTSQIYVDSTAGGTPVRSYDQKRKRITIKNIGSTDCYIGRKGVSSSNGFLLKASSAEGSEIKIDRSFGEIYAITVSSNTTLAILEE